MSFRNRPSAKVAAKVSPELREDITTVLTGVSTDAACGRVKGQRDTGSDPVAVATAVMALEGAALQNFLPISGRDGSSPLSPAGWGAGLEGITSPLPDISRHVVEAGTVRCEGRDQGRPEIAVSLNIHIGKAAVPDVKENRLVRRLLGSEQEQQFLFRPHPVLAAGNHRLLGHQISERKDEPTDRTRLASPLMYIGML